MTKLTDYSKREYVAYRNHEIYLMLGAIEGRYRRNKKSNNMLMHLIKNKFTSYYKLI